MVIKNKDGTAFELRGPNPLMNTQTNWDKSAIKLANLKSKPEIIQDNLIDEAESNIVNIRDELNLTDNPETKFVRASEFIKELTAPVVEVKPIVQKTVEAPKEVQINVDPKLAKIIKERGVEFYCAPAVDIKRHTDDFYGSSYETTVYGEQFIFDAIIIAESNLQIQFWSVSLINVNSIVLKKDTEGGERWWRVSKTNPKTGGHLSLCDISDSNPDFS